MDGNKEKVQRLHRMKEDLQRHYAHFKELKAAGEDEAALRQFNVTLKAATDLLEASARLLKDVSAVRTEDGAREIEGKIYHIPRNTQTH